MCALANRKYCSIREISVSLTPAALSRSARKVSLVVRRAEQDSKRGSSIAWICSARRWPRLVSR